MTNDEMPRAAAFLNRALLLELEDADLHIVLDDLLDVDHYDRDNVLGRAMNDLHDFGLTLISSDDDYDDFRREVCGLLAGDDACPKCELDPDDCECDEDDD
jgi:hypothetical protein